MNRLSITLLFLLALMCVQCGEKDLILTVDLLSYVGPEYISTEYGPVPPGTPATVFELIQVEADLLQGVDGATQVKSATLQVGADFVNESGSAAGSLAVFIASANDPEPFSTTPVADIPVTLQPGHTTTVSEVIPSTPELLEVLTTDEAWFAVRLTYNTEGSAEDLRGVVTLTELTAVLVTKTDL